MTTLKNFKDLGVYKQIINDNIDLHKFKTTCKIKVYLYDDIININSKVSIETAKNLCKKNKINKISYELGDDYIII